jgi:type IV pilus assembly protein PilA
MAILAVLAAIAVPRYTGILADSKAKADTANVQLLQNAVEVYYAQNSAYPTDLATLVTAGLLKAVPTQSTPTAGAPFVYTASTGTVSE